MPAVADTLRRFRFHGVPGAPVAAVPLDRRSRSRAELEPVFRAVGDAPRAAAEIVLRARRDADRTLADAREEAERILAEARAGLGAELARAALTRPPELDAQCQRALDRGRIEAERIDGISAERVEGLVREAVAHISAFGEPSTAGSTPGARSRRRGDPRR